MRRDIFSSSWRLIYSNPDKVWELKIFEVTTTLSTVELFVGLLNECKQAFQFSTLKSVIQTKIHRRSHWYADWNVVAFRFVKTKNHISLTKITDYLFFYFKLFISHVCCSFCFSIVNTRLELVLRLRLDSGVENAEFINKK